MKSSAASPALLLKHDSGQNLIEYALIAGLIALAAVLAATTFGSSISTAFSRVSSQLTWTSPGHHSGSD